MGFFISQIIEVCELWLAIYISHGGNLYYRKLKNNYDKQNGNSHNIV